MGTEATEEQPRLGALRVFIVEDWLNVQIALRELLNVIGSAEVAAVANTEAEALDWAGTHRGCWDLAIVDLILSEGAGFNVIGRLKEHHPQGHVIVFSAFLSDAVRRHCLSLGADVVLRKQDVRQLVEHVERFTGV